MKNKNYMMFGLRLATLLIGLISAPAWAVPAGKLVAWGNNQYGQTNVPAGNDFKAIAAGAFHSLALKTDGSLVAWGENNVGQVSNVPSGNGFVAIAGGWGQSLVLKTDGSLVGWGWNINGQATPPAGTNFVASAAGWRHRLSPWRRCSPKKKAQRLRSSRARQS